MQLTAEHIDYIIKDVHYRGIVVDGLKDEIIDHICSAIETEMKSGKRFIDAYHHVLKSFGHTGGLREIQTQTVNA
jgi:putative ABC transport system permease protein